MKKNLIKHSKVVSDLKKVGILNLKIPVYLVTKLGIGM